MAISINRRKSPSGAKRRATRGSPAPKAHEKSAIRSQASLNDSHNHADRIPHDCADSGSAEDTEGWKFLWDSEKEFDQQMIDGWKDELNNLLVFAGLFSAVVTTFAAESYQLLQEDPADRSAQLLERISLQLASFTLAPGFVNATQALPPLPVFQRNPVNSAINALRFLSLTLSLLAAFFAIAAQQWLRSLPLPRHLSLVNSMRLRQGRHESLIVCQIPQIISFLPVTLQLAVVMFLVGLYLFLRTLEYSIAVTFAVVAGIPFALYGLSLFMPLFWPTCAYKSPLVPAVNAAFRWILLPAVWSFLILVGIPLLFGSVMAVRIWVFVTSMDRIGRQRLRLAGLRMGNAMIWPAILLTMRAIDNVEDFWVGREARLLRSQSQSELTDIDSGSLSYAPQSVPRDQLGRLTHCLCSLPLKQRCRTVVSWTMFELGDYGDAGFASYFMFSPIRTELLQRVDRAFAEDYQELLMVTLPQEWTSKNWRDATEALPCIFILLMRTVQSGVTTPESLETIVRQMIEGCKVQEIASLTKSNEDTELLDIVRYPPACLFGCVEKREHEFSVEATDALMVLATIRTQECCAFDDSMKDMLLIDIPDIIFGLSATALIAFSQQTSLAGAAPRLAALLSAVDGYVTEHTRDLRSMASICAENPDEPLLVTPRAIVSVAQSLMRMREAGRIPETALEQCKTLVGHLEPLCAECPGFEGAFQPLRDFEGFRSIAGGLERTETPDPVDSDPPLAQLESPKTPSDTAEPTTHNIAAIPYDKP